MTRDQIREQIRGKAAKKTKSKKGKTAVPPPSPVHPIEDPEEKVIDGDSE